jgi:hypothetical protein
MTFSIADLRKSRGDFTAITKALEKTNGGYENDEADFFKVQRDKAGNGSAVLRFLPKHPEDDLPWVQVYSHSFQGPTGRWYIENSRTTLGEADPVSECNAQLWKTGLDSDKEIARKQKRRLHYVANILVVSYPTKPELEGQILRFKFGKKIFEKLMESANPTFEDEKPLNPFDPFEGANFKLRMRQVEGYPNYDKSEFADASPIAGSDEEIVEILNKMTSLKELVDPSKFKSYEELKRKFDSVMNGTPTGSKTAEEVAESMSSMPIAAPKTQGKIVAEPKNQTKSKPAPQAEPESDGDDIEDYFRSISES